MPAHRNTILPHRLVRNTLTDVSRAGKVLVNVIGIGCHIKILFALVRLQLELIQFVLQCGKSFIAFACVGDGFTP